MRELRILYPITGTVGNRREQRLVTLKPGCKVRICSESDENELVEVVTEDQLFLNVFASDLAERSEPVRKSPAAAGT